MKVYLVGPLADVWKYEGQTFQRSDDAEPLEIGTLVREPEGVDNRRAFIKHNLSEAGIDYARQVLKNNGDDDTVEIRETPPNNWRWKDQL